LVLGGLVLAAVLSPPWLRVNLSPSAPYGLYRLTALPTPLTTGTLVLLPVPEMIRLWHSRWLPLLKPVAAVAGETVCVRDETLWIGGTSYGPVYRAAQGRTLPVLRGCITVPQGEVFLASQAARSLDSRYFGAVPLAHLTAQAIPVVTWR